MGLFGKGIAKRVEEIVEAVKAREKSGKEAIAELEKMIKPKKAKDAETVFKGMADIDQHDPTSNSLARITHLASNNEALALSGIQVLREADPKNSIDKIQYLMQLHPQLIDKGFSIYNEVLCDASVEQMGVMGYENAEKPTGLNIFDRILQIYENKVPAHDGASIDYSVLKYAVHNLTQRMLEEKTLRTHILDPETGNEGYEKLKGLFERAAKSGMLPKQARPVATMDTFRASVELHKEYEGLLQRFSGDKSARAEDADGTAVAAGGQSETPEAAAAPAPAQAQAQTAEP